uniref:Integrase, catalytic region, zinc finger, CCHC-type, peptidase aspartic, catalytic n=1 Tax=Tanacetum cinerariifolium TaxID=118510 RepID=A0A699JPX8_TANCI|nr:hypothetical protein [Tanacetum cinerariifolium]
MSNQLEDIQAAGFDTGPPMLDKTDFESWKQRIRLYCKGKDHESPFFSILTKTFHNLKRIDSELTFVQQISFFKQHKGENIHDYYVRFTKLINNMRYIKMTMPKIQLNSKFVNNMLPAWGRFETVVKLNRGLKESNHDQLYAYLKQHESHANKNKMQMERLFQHSHDPLALVFNALPYQYTSSSFVPPQSSFIPPVPYQP